jgi:type 1 fimbriae regulatory protein FimB
MKAQAQRATEGTFCKESLPEAPVKPAQRTTQSNDADSRNVKSEMKGTVDGRSKDYLTEAEMKRFLDAARSGRHGVRDYALLLMAYRHGMRVSELIDVRLSDVDLVTARLFVRRKKGSLSTHQPIEGDELRAIKAWLRQRSVNNNASCSPFLFLSERGPMTRQASQLSC